MKLKKTESALLWISKGIVDQKEIIYAPDSLICQRSETCLEHGSERREPYVKPIRGKENKGLYELRIKFANDIVRIFYFTYYNGKYILLHGFLKKTMKTPRGELERARNYMEDYKRRSKRE